MYIQDLFQRLLRRKNIPALIYLIFNACFIIIMASGFFYPLGMISALIIGIAIYFVSLSIGVSPVGEWILRKQTGCKKISPEISAYLDPLFQEVYAEARNLDPTIPEDVQIFYSNEEAPNAFATGRRTICVTKGLLNMPADQIKATLGHEFGHLAHKDTDLILFIAMGNLVVNCYIGITSFFVRIIGTIFYFRSFYDPIDALVHIVYLIVYGLYNVSIWLWTYIGVLLVMKTSRENEYEADAFSFRLGYGDSLCALLNVIGNTKPKGLFAALASSHPDKESRIRRLQELSTRSQTF